MGSGENTVFMIISRCFLFLPIFHFIAIIIFLIRDLAWSPLLYVVFGAGDFFFPPKVRWPSSPGLWLMLSYYVAFFFAMQRFPKCGARCRVAFQIGFRCREVHVPLAIRSSKRRRCCHRDERAERDVFPKDGQNAILHWGWGETMYLRGSNVFQACEADTGRRFYFCSNRTKRILTSPSYRIVGFVSSSLRLLLWRSYEHIQRCDAECLVDRKRLKHSCCSCAGIATKLILHESLFYVAVILNCWSQALEWIHHIHLQFAYMEL